MKYAIIKDDLVVNVVIWDGEEEYLSSETLLDITNSDIGIGWRKTDDIWIPPYEEPIVLPDVI